jgi:hypothetical protein
MTRVFPFLAAAATAALLAFGGAAYSATANGGDGPGHPGGPPGGPSAGNAGGPASALPRVDGCDFRADQMGLDDPARRAFLWRCRQGGAL